MTYRVVIMRSAEREIRQIVDWWRDHRSIEQAERWYRKIYPAIATLARQPQRCPVSPETDLVPTGLRQLHFGIGRRATHRIIFTVVGQEVRVMRVRHAAQRNLTLDDLM